MTSPICHNALATSASSNKLHLLFICFAVFSVSSSNLPIMHDDIKFLWLDQKHIGLARQDSPFLRCLGSRLMNLISKDTNMIFYMYPYTLDIQWLLNSLPRYLGFLGVTFMRLRADRSNKYKHSYVPAAVKNASKFSLRSSFHVPQNIFSHSS